MNVDGIQFLADQLTPFQPGGADYAYQITMGQGPQIFGWCGVSAGCLVDLYLYKNNKMVNDQQLIN